ncbi:MAG: hypothetical protein V3S34_01905, partial [Hyphomicrobium sp.]
MGTVYLNSSNIVDDIEAFVGGSKLVDSGHTYGVPVEVNLFAPGDDRQALSAKSCKQIVCEEKDKSRNLMNRRTDVGSTKIENNIAGNYCFVYGPAGEQ